MKFIITLVLALLVAYVSWPYYHLYRLDAALGSDDTDLLLPLIDQQRVRAQLQQRIQQRIESLSGGHQPDDSILGALQSTLKEWTGQAVEVGFSLEQIRDLLREAAREHSDESPPYFISAVDFAFFESPDSFIIRLGDIDQDPDYVRMKLEAGRWVVTDIVF